MAYAVFLFAFTATVWDSALCTFDTSVSVSDLEAFEELLYHFANSELNGAPQSAGLAVSDPVALTDIDSTYLAPVTAIQTYPGMAAGAYSSYDSANPSYSEATSLAADTWKQAGPYSPLAGFYNQQQPLAYPFRQSSTRQSQRKPVRQDDARSYRKRSKKKKKKKKEKVFVPIVIRKRKKKKKKTVATYKGFYIPGGTQVFGKFKKIKDCKKICEVTPNCFGADYNPWLKKCYLHTNITACEEMRTHPKLIHFKKIPCDLVETPRGLITLGTQIFGGLQQKGIKSLQDCIKKCATAGSGIAPDSVPENIARQICFGIDYDFATHKCYFHTDDSLCPEVPIIPTPVQLVEAPSVINILLCPFSELTT